MKSPRKSENFFVHFDDVFTSLAWRGMHPLTLKAIAQATQLGRLQLEMPLYQIMKIVSNKGEIGISELGDILGVTAATASRHVSTLVSRGYVDRTSDPSDGRAALVRLSMQGEDELQRQRETWQQLLAGLVSTWSEKDRKKLLEGMDRLEDAFSELHESLKSKGEGRP